MNNQDKIHVLSRAVIVAQDKLLLCKTVGLDINFYFLPGGHVEHGESAEKALQRELKEETGFDCTIKRYLGCLEYGFEPTNNRVCHNHEYNFVFEVESEHLKSNKKPKCSEKHIELSWLPISSLSDIDFRAAPLKKLLLTWLSGSEHPLFMSEMNL